MKNQSQQYSFGKRESGFHLDLIQAPFYMQINMNSLWIMTLQMMNLVMLAFSIM